MTDDRPEKKACPQCRDEFPAASHGHVCKGEFVVLVPLSKLEKHVESMTLPSPVTERKTF